MLSISHLEKAISIASRIKDALVQMSLSYSQLPEIIRREHQSIKKSDLIDVEEIAEEKLKMALEIEANFNLLGQLSGELGRVASAMISNYDFSPSTVSECIEVMETIAENYQEKGFGAQVFEHVLSGIRAAFDELKSLKLKSQPVIEQNRAILQRIMVARQENLRFWQEISAAVLAPYDGQGKKRKSTSTSVLNVKA